MTWKSQGTFVRVYGRLWCPWSWCSFHVGTAAAVAVERLFIQMATPHRTVPCRIRTYRAPSKPRFLPPPPFARLQTLLSPVPLENQIRLEAHPAASTLPFAAAAQRARLAALNALAVAPVPYGYGHGSSAAGGAGVGVGAGEGDDHYAVASICPPLEERRLDSAGLPAGVRTAAVLGREAVAAAAAMVVAEDEAAAAAAGEEDWMMGERKMGGVGVSRAGAGGGAGAMAVAAGDVSVTVVTTAGVSGVLEALRSAGRFEEAADVALRGLEQVGMGAAEAAAGGGGGGGLWLGTFFSTYCCLVCALLVCVYVRV